MSQQGGGLERSWRRSVGIYSGSKQRRLHNLWGTVQNELRCASFKNYSQFSDSDGRALNQAQGSVDYTGHMLIMLGWGVRFMGGTTSSRGCQNSLEKQTSPSPLCSQKTPPLNDHSETNKSCLG